MKIDQILTGKKEKLSKEDMNKPVFDLISHVVTIIRRDPAIHELLKMGVEEYDYHYIVRECANQIFMHRGDVYVILLFKYDNKIYSVTPVGFSGVGTVNSDYSDITTGLRKVLRSEPPVYRYEDNFNYENLIAQCRRRLVMSLDKFVEFIEKEVNKNGDYK